MRRDPLERNRPSTLLASKRTKIDHHIRLERPQFRQETVEVAEVAMNVPSPTREVVLELTTMEHRDVVPTLEQLANDERPGEPRTAEHKDTHPQKTLSPRRVP